MIEYAGQTLEGPGWIRHETLPDLYWPGGDHAILTNSRLDRPVEHLTPSEAPVMGGKPLTGLLNQADLMGAPAGTPGTQFWDRIGYGQCWLVGPPDARPTQSLRVQYHQNPPMNTNDALEDWGKSSRLTTSGGSGNLFVFRVPAAVAISRHIDDVKTHPRLVGAPRRLALELLRGCHFERNGVWWTTKTDPKLCPYRGYTKNPAATGGPCDDVFPNTELPAGQDFGGTGWMTPDPDHHHGDILSTMAYLFEGEALGSIAAISAQCFMETAQSVQRRESSTGGRGHWHVLRGIAAYGRINEVRALEMLNEEIERIEARNVYLNGIPILSHVDRGNSTDSYHMNPNDVAWIASLTGASTTDLARSYTSFMGALGIFALETCIEVFGARVLNGRVYSQLELALASIDYATKPTYDVDKVGVLQQTTPSIVWDDVAPPVPKCEAWRGQGSPSDSVRNRFMTWALYAGYLRTKNEGARDLWLQLLQGTPWQEPLEVLGWVREG